MDGGLLVSFSSKTYLEHPALQEAGLLSSTIQKEDRHCLARSLEMEAFFSLLSGFVAGRGNISYSSSRFNESWS